MDEQNYIDIYCERLDGSFWSEPINALTNLSFILAALFAFIAWKSDKKHSFVVLMLIINAFIIGIGSFLFHTFASKIAMFGDIIPIAIFVLSAICIFITKVMKLSQYKIIGVLALFLGLIIGSRMFVAADFLNGSVQYFPALLALAFFAGYSKSRHFTLATITFVTAIFFRSIDMRVCESFPLGTHFMWHLLNGLVVYLVIKGIIKAIR